MPAVRVCAFLVFVASQAVLVSAQTPTDEGEQNEESSSDEQQASANTSSEPTGTGTTGMPELDSQPPGASIDLDTECPKQKLFIDMSKQVGVIEAQLTEKKSEMLELQKKLDSQDQTISDMRNQADQWTSDLAAKDARIIRLTEQVTEQTTKVEQTDSALKQKDSELQQKNEEIASHLEKADQQVAANEQVKVELAKQNAEIEKLKGEGEAQTTELDAAKASVLKLTEELKAEKEKVAQGEKELEELTKDHGDLLSKHQLLSEKYADPSVQHFLKSKAVKVYRDPGIEGAANKTYKYVIPTLRERYGQGKQFLHESEKVVYSKLNAYVSSEKVEPWLPAISGYLVYGTVIVPFVCTICCLTRIVCKMRLLLLFCHLDFLFTTLSAVIFAVWTGREPLISFAHHDAAVYLFTQTVYALIFCLYAVVLCLACTCAKSGTREGCYRLTQILLVVPIFFVYYRHVWTPAMLDQMPRMDQLAAWVFGGSVPAYAWLPYAPVVLLFLIVLQLERLAWRAGSAGNPTKVQDQISITIRDDVNLGPLNSIGVADAETYGKKQ